MTFHDNAKKKYDENGRISNNWDASIPHPDNEYVKVHFRINTPSYTKQMPVGFNSDADRRNFFNEAAEVLEAIGWHNERFHTGERGCYMIKGKAKLYLHPQEISGVVAKNEVLRIAEALESRVYFKITWVDIYETILDIDDEEYMKYLKGKDKEFRHLVLLRSRTNRRNKYYNSYDIARSVSRSICISRICDLNICGINMAEKYILEQISKLIDTGYLVSVKKESGLFIRTINKTEQKQKKLFIDDAA